MASSFPLNMCITMEPPVRYDTYHVIGVPPFIVDFRTVNNPSASSDSRIRRVDQPAAGTRTRATKKNPVIALTRSSSLVKCALRNAKIAAPATVPL